MHDASRVRGIRFRRSGNCSRKYGRQVRLVATQLLQRGVTILVTVNVGPGFFVELSTKITFENVSIRQPNKEVFRLDRKDWTQVERDARKFLKVKR